MAESSLVYRAELENAIFSITYNFPFLVVSLGRALLQKGQYLSINATKSLTVTASFARTQGRRAN